MFEPCLGQIMLVPYNFAPRRWAFCHSQLLPIAQKTALFSLVGTTFGGDGHTTFAYPTCAVASRIAPVKAPACPTMTAGKSAALNT